MALTEIGIHNVICLFLTLATSVGMQENVLKKKMLKFTEHENTKFDIISGPTIAEYNAPASIGSHTVATTTVHDERSCGHVNFAC